MQFAQLNVVKALNAVRPVEEVKKHAAVEHKAVVQAVETDVEQLHPVVHSRNIISSSSISFSLFLKA